jgi:hypothetical protein
LPGYDADGINGNTAAGIALHAAIYHRDDD